jgi:RimJ/RimL family protein N-acetyltransferase
MDIVLEELERSDFAVIRDWIDPAVFRIFDAPVDDAQLERLLTRKLAGRLVDLGYRAIDRGTGEIVGAVHVTLNWRNDLAHIGQIVIGGPRRRGRGIGTAIMELVLAVIFETLGMHRAQLLVDEHNAQAIRCYEKAGLTTEGMMREASRLGEKRFNLLSMSILAPEWRSRNSGAGRK